MSKNYQIKYAISIDDLTPAKLKEIKKNLDSLASHQLNLDKKKILSRQAVFNQIRKEKNLEKEHQQKILQNEMYKAKNMRLLGRERVMLNTANLRKMRGDEDALKRYLMSNERRLSEVRGKVFRQDDQKGRYENTLKELSLMNQRNRAETMLGQAINSNNRKREQAVSLQQQIADRRGQANIAVGAASGAALYAGGRATAYALGQTMTLEQMGISMRAQFGVEQGNLAMIEMKNYARDTAFTLKEATQLLLGVKIGAKNIGIQNPQQMVAFTKEIGKSILAYGGNQEDRYEIGHQLSQIFMAGTASTRQDLKVIARRGLPIFEALEASTGKTYKELQSIYGTELPAALIAKAILYMSKSDSVSRATMERASSFTQSFEAATEQFGYTSGKFGDVVAKAFRLPDVLRGFTNSMAGLEDMLGEDNFSGMTSLLFTVSSLTLGFMTISGLITACRLGMQYFAASTLAANVGLGSMSLLIGSILSKVALFSGISSAIYLAISDWGKMFDDGLTGILGHLDKLIAMLAVLGTGFLVGGLPGLLIAATGLAGVGAYKYLKHQGDLESQEMDKWRDSTREINTGMSQSNAFFGAAGLYDKPNMTLMKDMTPTINVDTVVQLDPTTGKSKTKTEVRSPNYNAVYTNFSSSDKMQSIY
jgi:tape measure domain-containing protein